MINETERDEKNLNPKYLICKKIKLLTGLYCNFNIVILLKWRHKSGHKN